MQVTRLIITITGIAGGAVSDPFPYLHFFFIFTVVYVILQIAKHRYYRCSNVTGYKYPLQRMTIRYQKLQQKGISMLPRY